MNKITKSILLFSIGIAFAVISLFDLTLGTLNFLVNVLRFPFKKTSDWLLKKSAYITIR